MDIETKNLARALRRHHVARLKKNRRAFWGRLPSNGLGPMDPRQLGMCVTTPHPCSSLCCGNPRKWLGELTKQELRQKDHLRDAR